MIRSLAAVQEVAMVPGWLKGALVLAMVLNPRPVPAQCAGGMMGGGHDHGSTAQRSDERKEEPKEDRKARQDVARLLAGQRSRSLLLDGILNDPEFMQMLAARVAESPAWRPLFVAHLEPVDPAARGDSAEVRRTTPKPGPDIALYRCPMHPEATSRSPGKCPRCGMTLERVE